MILVRDGTKMVVETKQGILTMGAVVKVLAKKANKPLSVVAFDGNVDHSLEWLLTHDRSNSGKTFIGMMNGLGYDCMMMKREINE